MTQNDLNNFVEVDYWDIQEKIKGAVAVSARPSTNNTHLNLYVNKQNQKSFHVEIPYSNVNIADTKDGLVISTI